MICDVLLCIFLVPIFKWPKLDIVRYFQERENVSVIKNIFFSGMSTINHRGRIMTVLEHLRVDFFSLIVTLKLNIK